MKLFIVCYFWIELSVYWVDGQTPSSRNRDDWYKEEWPQQPYAFGYEIRDYSGNEQYRKEMSDGDRVTGSYGYLGPDGLYRHVEYIADDNGFRAKIRTSEPGTSNDNPSNVEFQSNPIQVLTNRSPVSGSAVDPGVAFGGRQPNTGFAREQVRPVPNRSLISPNPNRSTYANQPPIRSPLPQIPDPTHDTNSPPEGNRIDINRRPELLRPLSPNYNEPHLRPSPIVPTRGLPVEERVTYTDIPDNVRPFRGGNPNRTLINVHPLGAPTPNGLVDQNIKPYFGGTPVITDPNRSPNFEPNPLPPLPPSPPPPPPYDRRYDRNENPVFADNRGPQSGGSNRGGYELTTKGGFTKIPPKDLGFIEATKGPISPFRPMNRFYDKKTTDFDDDNEDYNQFKRRHDEDRNIVNKPVFEDRDIPKKIGGFVRFRHNATRPVISSGTKTIGPIPPFRDTFNKTLNESQFNANEGRRDGYDKKVGRPTKVFITSGPISGIANKRPDIRQKDRSFGAIDEQQRQDFDIDYDDKNVRDGKQIGLDGVKGHRDRDRPQPYIPLTGVEQPQSDIKPYFGARREVKSNRSQEQLHTTRPHLPVPPYDPNLEQQHIQSYDDIPVQRDNEFPEDRQTVAPFRPQVYQPLRPNHRPDRQPSLPRRPDRPYKPRTQSPDRPYIEQQQIEVQPYGTQSSATISSPVNTIPTAYKPIDSLEDDKQKTKEDNSKPSLNTPFAPTSYIVTPFPANETKKQFKPTIANRSQAPVYTVDPELTQMEIPKFGTRLRLPELPAQDTYEPIDELYDEKDNQQKERKESVVQNDYQNGNNYQIDDQNEKPLDNSDPIPTPSPQISDNMDNVEKDQYYYDDPIDDQSDQTHEDPIESKDHPIESKDNPIESKDNVIENKDNLKSLLYSQSMSRRSDEKVDITSNSNNSLPIEIRHKIIKAINWHKFDAIDGSGRQTVVKPVPQVVL